MQTGMTEKLKREVDRSPLTKGEKVVLARLRKKLMAKRNAQQKMAAPVAV